MLVNSFWVASLSRPFAVRVWDKMVLADGRGADRETVMAILRAGEIMNFGPGLFGPVPAPVELADLFRRGADIYRNDLQFATHSSAPREPSDFNRSWQNDPKPIFLRTITMRTLAVALSLATALSATTVADASPKKSKSYSSGEWSHDDGRRSKSGRQRYIQGETQDVIDRANGCDPAGFYIGYPAWARVAFGCGARN